MRKRFLKYDGKDMKKQLLKNEFKTKQQVFDMTYARFEKKI